MLTLSEAQRQTRRRDIDRLIEVQGRADSSGAAADTLAERLDALAKALLAMGSGAPEITSKLDDARKKARDVAAELGRISTRMNALYRDVIGSPFVPTDTQKDEVEQRAKDLEAASATFDTFRTQTLPALETELSRAIGGTNLLRITP
jgi:hypothetical protein